MPIVTIFSSKRKASSDVILKSGPSTFSVKIVVRKQNNNKDTAMVCTQIGPLSMFLLSKQQTSAHAYDKVEEIGWFVVLSDSFFFSSKINTRL